MDPSNQHKHDSTSGQRQRIILRKPRKRGLASVSEVAKAALKVRKENPFLVKRGVPSLLRPSITLRQETTEPTHAGDHDRNDNSSFNDGDNNDDGNSNGDESFWSDSDTMLVIRSLQQGVESNVPIPLRGRTGGSSPPLLLRAVVECQVHARLATLRPSGVASELNDLLRQGLIVQLRTPDKTVNPHQASVAMLLTQQDWERGVRDALRGLVCTRDDGIEIHTINTIAEWFLERVKNEWAGFHSITSMQFKAALTKHPLGGPSVVADSNNTIACISMLDETKIMNCLQQIQVILPTNNHSAYQLWLPEWGIVLNAWQKASTQLLTQLKRSYNQERSISGLQQKHSPIPTNVVIEWLKYQGIVESVERPSGIFLHLVENYPKGMSRK